MLNYKKDAVLFLNHLYIKESGLIIMLKLFLTAGAQLISLSTLRLRHFN